MMKVMLEEIAEGVLVLRSVPLENNAVVIEGPGGVLVIDPGQTRAELAKLAAAIADRGVPVVAGFATHSHWDHVLWHADLGDAPRYGTIGTVDGVRDVMALPDWKKQVSEQIPPEIAGEVPLDALFGRLVEVPTGSETVPWDGPETRILEHRAHAAGHAALVIEDHGVLVAGDMLSDVFIPMLDFSAEDPIGDYLAALDLFESVATSIEIVIPGHGQVGRGEQVRARIDLDRAYVHALREGVATDDPRISAARPGWEWVKYIHEGQVERLGP